MSRQHLRTLAMPIALPFQSMSSATRCLAALMLLLACASGCRRPGLGGTLPSGERVALLKPGDDAVVLVFVAPDCPISNRYVPTYNRLHGTLRAAGVGFFLVYSDDTFSAERIAEHRREYAIEPEVLVDHDQRLQKLVGAEKTPQAFLLDERSRVRYAGRIDDRWVDFGRFRPKASDATLENAVTAYLEGRAIEPARTQAIGCYLPETR